MTAEINQMLEDTTLEFLNTFGKKIKYLPAGGGEREILAIIERAMPDELNGAPHGHAPKLTISVANDLTIGISSDEVDTGGDKVELSTRINEQVQERTIKKILSQDVGMMTLEIR